MSDYLFIFRGGMPANLSPAEMQASMKKWTGWIGGIAQAGKLKGGQPLEKGGKVIHAKRVVTDGPYAEAKDLVGGYLIVTADNLDAALAIAQGCPAPEEGGSVEVRGIAPMPS